MSRSVTRVGRETRIANLSDMRGPSMRERFREHMRAAVLEAAHDLIVDRGWDRVRMGEVAHRAGVSRAALYKEFGDKAGLGEALVLREASRFLEGIQKALEAHIGDAKRGIAAAVDYTLNEAERSPLLKAVLISNRDLDAGSQASTGMLPLLTTSARLLDLASDTLAGWVAESYPSLPPDDVVDAADTMVRLTVSHLALPKWDRTATASKISEVAVRFLSLES